MSINSRVKFICEKIIKQMDDDYSNQLKEINQYVDENNIKMIANEYRNTVRCSNCFMREQCKSTFSCFDNIESYLKIGGDTDVNDAI